MKTMKDDISDLKDKVNQIHGLKDQLGQILENVTILNNKRDATTKNEEPASSHMAVTQTQYDEVQEMSIPFPQYGLPLGYTPPYENYVYQNQVPPQMSHITKNAHVAVEQGG